MLDHVWQHLIIVNHAIKVMVGALIRVRVVVGIRVRVVVRVGVRVREPYD